MNINALTLSVLTIAMLFGGTSFNVVAKSVDSTNADRILESVRDRYDGDDIYSEVTMEIEDKHGKVRTRKMYYLQRDNNKDSEMAIYFTDPSDVKGIGFQTVNYDELKGGDADQWMYLPAFRQNRRISAQDKRGSFMGSEYAYIDLDKIRVTDYEQVVLGEEMIDGRLCYKIERTPKSKNIINKTGYHKGLVWVDKERDLVIKEAYFDDRNIAFKTIIAREVEQVDGIWTVMVSEAINHLNAEKSRLIFSNVKYNVGVDEKLFKRRALKTALKTGKLNIK